jgi:uncharacterized protein YyaL (SSP411 family)
MRRAALVLAAVALVAAAPARAAKAPSIRDRALPLRLAEAGVVRARRHWWNPRFRWYDERISNRWNRRMPLVRLWGAFPLFETLAAIELADPAAANRAAVHAFAAMAERYYNEGVGGYAYYIGTDNATTHTYFDDNGWWAIAFLDAYSATAERRYLADAELAFNFIAETGWDPETGGVWWETLHLHKTSEPLAAEIYVGLRLYRLTGEPSYLETAEQFLEWANTFGWNAKRRLYARSDTDGTVLDDVQGMMIGARLELCLLRKQRHCTPAERLARASVAAFPRTYHRAPAPDSIYLRFLLDLYRFDRNPQWYAVARESAERALAKAPAGHGLYLRNWNGRLVPGQLLQTHAATLSLLAWLATVPRPTPGGLCRSL